MSMQHRRFANTLPMMHQLARTVLAFTIALSSFAGCDTIGQDMSHMMNVLMPPTPGEAARMMQDQYDADARRQGTVWISNAPFGGVDAYVANYRVLVEIEQDPTVKGAAIRALGRHGVPEDAMLIAPHLKHENEYVRWEAAKALQRLHNPNVITHLLEALREEEERSETKAAIATALGQYPQGRVFDALVAALDARELAVNMAAEGSLSTLTGQSFEMDAAQWLRWYSAQRPEDRFAGRTEYLYPTYQRDETFFERYVMFWSSRNFEHPAPPAGLESGARRQTSDFAEEQNQ